MLERSLTIIISRQKITSSTQTNNTTATTNLATNPKAIALAALTADLRCYNYNTLPAARIIKSAMCAANKDAS